jgi:hypothetical protein
MCTQGVRASIGEDLNRAILAHLGLPPHSPLERAAAQALVVVDVLRGLNHPQVCSWGSQEEGKTYRNQD